jgi:4-diphosphocytidyl-2-C-methyl-D-erythritol kinase
MIAFPHCKINLGLNILNKREDGFHNLETIFYPIHICDALEIIPSQSSTTITVTGMITGDEQDNLCIKAFNILKNNYPQLPDIKIHLHKAIPMGAGLGGGSSDAAFTLRLLNEKFNLDIPEEKICAYALQLGSDCPFFLLNKPGFATSRGEVIEAINISLKDYKIMLINPGIHVSTAEAFKNITPGFPVKKIKDIIHHPVESWKDELSNDFEKYAFEKYLLIKKIKEDLYKAGAAYASMSGSGSTVFGLFKKDVIINYDTEPGFFCKIVNAT